MVLPENLEERLEILKEIWENIELREQNFSKKTGLEKLSGTVYADKELVYKLDPQNTEPEALKKALGIEHVQKFVVFEYGVLVSERIWQKHYVQRTKVEKIHLENLIKTLIDLKKRGVIFSDFNEENMLYSKKEGFTLIDLSCEENPEIQIHNLAVTLSKGDKDEIIFYPLMSKYADVLDVFYSVDRKLAFETLKKYICFERDNRFKKVNKNSKQFQKMRNVLEKYALIFNELYFDKGSGRMFLS